MPNLGDILTGALALTAGGARGYIDKKEKDTARKFKEQEAAEARATRKAIADQTAEIRRQELLRKTEWDETRGPIMQQNADTRAEVAKVQEMLGKLRDENADLTREELRRYRDTLAGQAGQRDENADLDRAVRIATLRWMQGMPVTASGQPDLTVPTPGPTGAVGARIQARGAAGAGGAGKLSPFKKMISDLPQVRYGAAPETYFMFLNDPDPEFEQAVMEELQIENQARAAQKQPPLIVGDSQAFGEFLTRAFQARAAAQQPQQGAQPGPAAAPAPMAPAPASPMNPMNPYIQSMQRGGR